MQNTKIARIPRKAIIVTIPIRSENEMRKRTNKIKQGIINGFILISSLSPVLPPLLLIPYTID